MISIKSFAPEMNQLLKDTLNIESTCRFCLNGDPTELLSISKPLDINCSQNQPTNLEHIIMTCIGINVLENDDLPNWICRECVHQLTTSYTFREKCLETIKYLNNILVKTEPQIDSESSHFIAVSSDIYVDQWHFGVLTYDDHKLRPNEYENKFECGFEQAEDGSDSDKECRVTNLKHIESNSTPEKRKFVAKWQPGQFHRVDSGPFKCDICGSILKSRRTLVYHMRTLHIMNLIDKSEMPEKRPEPAEPRPPVLPGDNDTLFPFKCDICGSGLRTVESILDHMQKFHIDGNYLKRSVSADNPLECEICLNGYPNRKSLSRHRIRVHGIFKSHKPIRSTEPKLKSKVKRWQICPICGVMRKDMKCHIATHESDRLFKCEICGSDLKTAVNLKRHLRRVHTEDRQYPCNLCNVAFKAPFQLKRHNRKHTQERNYACTYCEKRFIDKATLERHFVVHFRERNVECKFCGKRFQSNLGLQNHVGIHTLERKFKCGLCSLAFITSSAASVHRRTHRNNVDNHFHCGDCDMKFQEVIMLKMHLRAVSHRFASE